MNEDLYSQQEVQKEGRNTRTIQEKDTNTAQKEQITRASIRYFQNATKQLLSSYECCHLLDRICQS